MSKSEVVVPSPPTLISNLSYEESTDPEFDDYQRHFGNMEKAAEKFMKDTKSFTEAVNSGVLYLLVACCLPDCLGSSC